MTTIYTFLTHLHQGAQARVIFHGWQHPWVKWQLPIPELHRCLARYFSRAEMMALMNAHTVQVPSVLLLSRHSYQVLYSHYLCSGFTVRTFPPTRGCILHLCQDSNELKSLTKIICTVWHWNKAQLQKQDWHKPLVVEMESESHSPACICLVRVHLLYLLKDFPLSKAVSQGQVQAPRIWMCFCGFR